MNRPRFTSTTFLNIIGALIVIYLLAAKRGSSHEAHHEVMECLGEMMWESQRSGMPPDGLKYIECVRRRATRG